MKKIIITTATVAALLTSVQADFNFGEMFKDMKEAAFTMNKDTQDTSVEVSTAKTTPETVQSVSADTKNSGDTSKSVTVK